MKVLIVCPRMDIYGGAELLIVRLANYLTRNSVENTLLTTNLSADIEKDLAGTQIIAYPYKRFQRLSAPLNLFRLLWRLHIGVRAHINDFDVINVHNYPAELSVFPFRKPVVWMCNEPPEVHVEFNAERRYTARRLVISAILGLEKRVVRKYVEDIVVADQFNARRFKDIYGITPHIINYGIDYDYFADYKRKAVERKGSHNFTVLHVGMLTPQKGQIKSLRAIHKLRDQIPGIRLILAGFGQGEYLFSLNEFVRSRNLEDIVLFEGHVDRERIRELYHTSDVLLHPIGPQGGWLAPFEAVASKLPVVVSKEMTASKLIKKNKIGVVTDDFAEALLDIYKNRSKYDKVAAQRAEWVRNNLSWDNFCEKMLGVFHRAINEHAQRYASVSMGI